MDAMVTGDGVKNFADHEVHQASGEKVPSWRFGAFDLRSSFQAVHDLGERRIVGHSGFLRPWLAGRPASPDEFFDSAPDDTTAIQMDHACGMLHAANYFSRDRQGSMLFVRAHPRMLGGVIDNHGKSYRRALEGAGLGAPRIAICLPDPTHLRTLSLARVIGGYRAHGLRIAVHLRERANLADLLARLRPDYIMMDIHSFAGAGEISEAIGVVRGHDTRILFTKVEHAEQLALLKTAGARYAQGFHLDS